MTTAKLERFRTELDDRVATGNGSTHSVETLTDGQLSTAKRIVKLWAQQADAAYKAGQPISNAVAISTANLVLNEKDRDRHVPRRKTTARRHLERLAYAGILLGDSAAKNTATGYTAPLWMVAAAPRKRVYFLNPGLCAWETLPADARMVCESPAGSLDVRELSALLETQQARTDTGKIGVTKPPAPPPPGGEGAPGAPPAPPFVPIWQTTYVSLTRDTVFSIENTEERERGESGTSPVFAAAGRAANPKAKACAPGAQNDLQTGRKHETPEVAKPRRILTGRQAAAEKWMQEWPHHARKIAETAAALVTAYAANVEPHNPQAAAGDNEKYWHQVQQAAITSLAWAAATLPGGFIGRNYAAFVELATDVCTTYLPEKIAAGRWQVMVSALQFFTCEHGYNLLAAAKGCEKWQKRHPKTKNDPAKPQKTAPKAPKTALKIWDENAQKAFLAEYTYGNISKNVLSVWAKLSEIHPADALIAAADLRAWRLALIELCRLHDPALVWDVIDWWLGTSDGQNSFLQASSRRKFWAQHGGCKSLTGLRKRFPAMLAQFREDVEDWKKADKKRGLATRRIATAETPTPPFPGEKAGRIKWDEAFMRDWDGTSTGEAYANALLLAGFIKVTDHQAGQRSALGYRFIHSKSGAARNYQTTND